MNHFVYSMNGKAEAPAAGGDMRSWFFFYKWDTGEDAFVPVPGEVQSARPDTKDLLWFVLDGVPLGYAPVTSVLDVDNGGYEVHYNTQQIIGRDQGIPSFDLAAGTGLADAITSSTLDRLKRLFDSTCPVRPSSALPPMPDGVHPGKPPPVPPPPVAPVSPRF